MITAPASGHGKTAITAALARYHRNQGRKVAVFKTGPDYLDPMILEQACGSPVQVLDIWMNGEADIRLRLNQAAQSHDLILVEGVMGLYDGNPSSADLARFTGIPLVAVIDAQSMATTFGAIVHGLQHYQDGIQLKGAIANRIGSPFHATLLGESLPDHLPLLAAFARESGMELPRRHLGLVQAQEIADLDQRLDEAATLIAETGLASLPEHCDFPAAEGQTALSPLLSGQHIAVARDQAFGFIYPANLELLEQLGAKLSFFSPVANETPHPSATAVWLPGGYPELHLEALDRAEHTRNGLHELVEQGGRIYGECGGLLYLLDELTDQQGTSGQMLGLLPGKGQLQNKLAALGMQAVELPTHAGQLRGHTFHHSRIETPLQPLTHARHATRGTQGEAVYQQGNITASYLHAYFPSNPQLVAKLFTSKPTHTA